ncbi:MAG: hypothetical protein A2149_05700 [Candidatus Schekmanbacteria bacterium RBG_16_38_11]|uniref:Isochorismatase-like domain-containing protein n=1 Tax=Candidatus Schekmanbacteria bacterium RBG_16_38_11 TaxID=1817880 RepID=A0A1F7S0M0_9BACT|nr:MAG: hypothetical protein A2149_05700 [Candidatus Schekmanbacteria bacterium RBG_16_38_11]
MAVIVVDVLKGFLEEGYPLYCGKKSRRIIEPVRKLLSQKKSKEPVIFLRDEHQKKDPEFKMFPPHCIKGSDECEVISELEEFWEKGFDVPKPTLSGFYKTRLDKILKEKVKPKEKITVVGVCTDICVLYTVADLRARYYDVIVPKDCVASFDESGHRFALKYMERMLGAKVV